MKRHITLLALWWVVPIQGFSFAPSHRADASGIHVLDSKLFMTDQDDDQSTVEVLTTKQDDDQSTVLTKQLCEHWEKENDPEQYWFNRQIHTLGNTGFFGAVHAAVGALSTKIIDKVAYKGRDVRSEVARELMNRVLENKEDNNTDIRVLDMCCGVGISTRALKKAFDSVENATIIGLDTSPEMVEMSEMLTVHESDMERVRGRGLFKLDNVKYFARKSYRRLRRKKPLSRQIEAAETSNITFYVGNAEATPFPEASFDLVTTMYAFHEVPESGRDAIIREARRLLKAGGIYAIVDISKAYSPSKSMLSGEPYVLEYQKNIDEQLANMTGFKDVTNEIIVPGHVELWQLIRDGMSVYEANQF